RRSPGTAGDVSRIVMNLPSIAKVDDQLNSLVVRGGNPTENAFFIDNIEIPNINHYPIQGSSGGPIGLINVDFIKDVSFSAGGFSASYGDRLSSVMDIKFREGNREEYDFQLDMHMAGAGVVAEGPLFDVQGSWMLSVRRSYLDLLVDAIGTGVAPRYSDYQGKIALDLNSTNKLTALWLVGIDYISFDSTDSYDEGNVIFGTSNGHEYSTGVNWRWLWSKKGYSNTSVSFLGTKYKGDFFETSSGDRLVEQNTLERSIQLRNVNNYFFNSIHNVEFGFDLKYIMDNQDVWTAEYTNAVGDTVDALYLKQDVRDPKYGLFLSYTVKPYPTLTMTMGARYNYFNYNESSHIAPRFSFSQVLSAGTTLNGAAGVYYQNLPLSLLGQNDAHKELEDPVAYHYILGINRLLTENTRLTLEAYYKFYENFPLDPGQPLFFIADEVVYRNFNGNLQDLTDDGEARSYGIEATLQKKLVSGFYGLVSGSYFRAEYKDLTGEWRDRIFDNQYLFNIEGGYKPNNNWEYSLRWIYAGGAPYTPLDLAKSRAINRNVLDDARVNELRYPDYHSLNLRVDRRFYWGGSNLILYLSVWNVYNRKNVSSYFWNEVEKKEDIYYQWSTLPVLGMEFEF
ncbi:MAG: TonB-dependent receptor plug domain-containing protein, partial [candidate division Zixibacteria bacterium]|nr:TonB-dependent receptor plug domain-containing protein [candidate division Zixibacteria bacterium]